MSSHDSHGLIQRASPNGATRLKMILTVLLGGLLLLGMLAYLFEVVIGKSRDRK